MRLKVNCQPNNDITFNRRITWNNKRGDGREVRNQRDSKDGRGEAFLGQEDAETGADGEVCERHRARISLRPRGGV